MKKMLQIKVGHQRVCIPLCEIVFLEKEKRKIIIHSINGEISFYGKYNDIMGYLDDRFAFPHKSYIFNMDYILRLGLSEVALDGGTRIVMGKECFRRCVKTFDGYVTKKVANTKVL